MRIPARLLLIILCAANIGCTRTPAQIPTGQWTYTLFVNGFDSGRAVVTNRIEGVNWVSSTELTIGMGDISNVSKQIVTETLDFKPVKLESRNRIITGGKVQSIDTITVFRGREAEITFGKDKAVHKIGKDFILEGNYILAKLIEGKFREGMEVEANIYDPTIELEEPILVKAKVMGYETVPVGPRRERLLHVTESIEAVKSIDLYLDENGILRKGVIQMLNMTMELVIR